MTEWISVNDRLPELGEDVLVYCKAKTPEFTDFIEVSVRNTYKLAPWCDEETAWGIRFIPFGGEFEVTHWMPLPEPPKEAYDGN